MARAMRNLVPVEVLAILALAIAPIPDAIPVALPLLVLATASKWLRGRDWAEVIHGGRLAAGIGAATGITALVVALVVGTPVVEALANRAVEWSTWPIVRGNAMQAVVVAVIVIATALAAELALRGWIVERVLELSPGPAVLPVLVGGIAEALVTPGGLAVRIGAGLFGIGLGTLYVAGNRSCTAPIVARITFSLGAIVVEALRLV